MRDRRQRRDGQGRHLLPDDGEEAPARPGDRRAEPAAVHLPGRLRRRVPSPAGRGLPGSRALRPHLLQPGAAVGGGDSADRAGDGQLHRRWRLRAGHVRRDGHRQGHGHHLPGRPTAGAGGHRRGGERRGSGRSGGPHRHLRRCRPLRAGRRARHRHRPPDRAQPGLAQAAAAMGAGGAGAAIGLTRRAVRGHPGRCRGRATTCARSSPAWSTDRSSPSSRSATARRWSAAGRTSRATRWGSSPTTGSCSAARH